MSALGDPLARPAASLARPRAWALLLAYPVLALLGAATRWHGFSLAAALVLVSVPLAPALHARRPGAWLLWLALVGGLLALAWCGLLKAVLETLPVLVNLFLAWLFGHTLRAGARPLIARLIAAVEDESRLSLPGVSRYARRLTVFWTALCASQALLIAVLLVLLRPAGAPHLPAPLAWWALVYVHAGAYVVMGLAFALEYPLRRWRLRHLPHLRLGAFLARLIACWPRLMGEQLRDVRR